MYFVLHFEILVATQSSSPSSNRPIYPQNANTPTYALHLTDGVRTIKAVEVGSVYSTTATSPEEWFQIGAKVKLKGPLKLRKGVLLLPNGTISNPAVTAQSPNSQCRFLGGEVSLLCRLISSHVLASIHLVSIHRYSVFI